MGKDDIPQPSDIIFYSTPEGDVKIEGIFNGENFLTYSKTYGRIVWLQHR